MAYRRVPITEAVLELRFVSQLSESIIESGARRFESRYPEKEKVESAEFQVDTLQKASDFRAKWNWDGLKLSSRDRADIVLLYKGLFGYVRLAPYNGWETFQAQAKDAWTTWRKSAGAPEIKRIGLRYVNRIDVPTGANTLIKVEDYLNILPRTPESLDQPMSGYTMQVTRPLGVDDCSVTLTSSTLAISPLVGFASFVLDLDVFKEKNIPRREDELWPVIDKMREHKNRIFESCITDKSRELFQR